jgi:K+-sensing histidine kinase KdpD
MNALDLAVIHDAKNNLGSLLMCLEKRGNFENEMQIILRASSRLTHLLLWHKEQEGEMSLNIDSASPCDMLKELCAEYQQVFPYLKLSFDDTQAPIFWFYDTNYVRLALENAVHNACCFASSCVSIKAELHNQQLVFTVTDDGKGFPQEVIKHLAEKQYTESSYRGTGLGMLLSSSIAEQHHNKGQHGQVTLRNEAGAVFEMRLP